MCLFSRIRALLSLSEPEPSEADLRDMGLSRIDYKKLQRSQPGTRARMEGIAARFGLTPADLDKDRGTLMEIAENCGQCRWARECREGLEGKAHFDELACPNAMHYLTMSAP